MKSYSVLVSVILLLVGSWGARASLRVHQLESARVSSCTLDLSMVPDAERSEYAIGVGPVVGSFIGAPRFGATSTGGTCVQFITYRDQEVRISKGTKLLRAMVISPGTERTELIAGK